MRLFLYKLGASNVQLSPDPAHGVALSSLCCSWWVRGFEVRLRHRSWEPVVLLDMVTGGRGVNEGLLLLSPQLLDLPLPLQVSTAAAPTVLGPAASAACPATAVTLTATASSLTAFVACPTDPTHKSPMVWIQPRAWGRFDTPGINCSLYQKYV